MVKIHNKMTQKHTTQCWRLWTITSNLISSSAFIFIFCLHLAPRVKPIFMSDKQRCNSGPSAFFLFTPDSYPVASSVLICLYILLKISLTLIFIDNTIHALIVYNELLFNPHCITCIHYVRCKNTVIPTLHVQVMHNVI